MTTLQLAYIDPGTGSMLFAIIIGLAATAIYALKGLRIKIKNLISGGKNKDLINEKIPYVIYSDNKRYWNVFKPVCDEFEARGVDVVYLTQSEDDPCFKAEYEHVKFEFIGEGMKGFTKLNQLKAGVVLSTTPSLDVFQWKRSKDVGKYVFITHSVDDGTVYRMFGLDYYDAILQTGEFALDKLRKIEELRGLPNKDYQVIGSTYMDQMKQKFDERTGANAAVTEADSATASTATASDTKTILLAPSWGETALLTKYGEKIIQALVDTGYDVVIRPHPQSFESEKELMDGLMAKFPEGEHLSWNRDTDNFDCLNNSDIMISDFSAVVFDYSFVFDKPVMYADAAFDTAVYDAAWLPDEQVWTLKVLSEIGRKVDPDDFPNMKSIIDEMLTDKSYEERRQEVRDYAWMHKGEAAKQTVDYLEKSLEEVKAAEAAKAEEDAA